MHCESDTLKRFEIIQKTKKLFQSGIEPEPQSTQLYHIIYVSFVVSTSASQVRHEYVVFSCFITELPELL